MTNKETIKNADKLLKTMVRVYCEQSGLYQKANKIGLGLEETEEMIIKMINKGELVIAMLEDKSRFWIQTNDK